MLNISNGLKDFIKHHKENKLKTIFVSVLSVFMISTMLGVSLSYKEVNIIDADTNFTAHTIKKDYNDILKENKIELSQDDVVEFSGWEQKPTFIKIKRSIEIPVSVDGTTINIKTFQNEYTLSELLKMNNIVLGEHDLINISLDDKVKKEDEIVIKRVVFKDIVKKEALPFETTNKESSSLLKGTTKVSVKGVEGEEVFTYKEMYIDGELVESNLVNRQVTRNPVNQVNLVGTAVRQTPSIISMPGDIILDENNIPISYKRVLNGKATAYSARPGSLTASGRPAIPGHVAVNPNIIPYGTRLYIATPDGSYVYGYAIAADTGTALMQGTVLVDVFFNTYQESVNFGAKNVNVYILD